MSSSYSLRSARKTGTCFTQKRDYNTRDMLRYLCKGGRTAVALFAVCLLLLAMRLLPIDHSSRIKYTKLKGSRVSIPHTENTSFTTPEEIEVSYKPIPKNASSALNVTIASESTDDVTAPLVRATGNAVVSIDTKKVLLMAYHRGGSSFLGDIFNHHKEVFYLFEPFHGIFKQIRSTFEAGELLVTNAGFIAADMDIVQDSLVKDWKKTYSHLPMELQDRVSEDVINTLNCSFAYDTLTNYFLLKWNKSVKAEAYANCYNPRPGRLMSKLKTQRCGHLLTGPCKESNFRVVKSIRVPTYIAGPLLERDDNLFIIHYVRDPRGMFLSRAPFLLKTRSFNKASSKLINEAMVIVADMCQRMRDDLEWWSVYSSQHPKRTLRVRYEDLAVDPQEITRKMFEFVGLELESDVQHWLANSTAAQSDSNALGTTRKNSTQTAFQWRNLIGDNLHSRILRECNDVLKQLNYI